MRRPELTNPDLAEFVGIMLGDGSIGRYECSRGDSSSSEQFVVKVTISKDESDYEDYIFDLFEKLFAIEPISYRKKNENTLDIRCFNPDLFDFMTGQVGLKTAPKKDRALIPERYMTEELRKEVLRGYFDTDGSLVLTDNNGYLYPRLEMKISRSPMQEQFVQLIEDEGFRFGNYELENGKIRIQMNGEEQLQKWVEEVGFSNQRHLDKLERFKRG
ncbi:MAG: hypothetical protein ABEK16_01615 [Candidatus Nanohalobium sp.]